MDELLLVSHSDEGLSEIFNCHPSEMAYARLMPTHLKEGESAPQFSALTQDGSRISLSDFDGKLVVLYFYPKDNTPGCTTEACGFRDAWKKLARTGAVLLGVSPDSPKSHQKFIAKYQLPFTLLADEDRKIVQDYGVWGEKKFMGRKYMGVWRVTFLIGRKGKIQKIWDPVKAAVHAEEVLLVLETA